MVDLSSSCSFLISSRISVRSLASRLESGSSNRNTPTFLTSARPMATRWRWPPESCAGLRSSSGSICSSFAAQAMRRSISARSSFCADEAELEVPAHGLGRIERVGLEHHGEAAILGIEVGDVAVADGDPAGGDVEQAGEQVEQRGLAAARGAEQDQELAVLDREVEVLEHGQPAVGLDDVFELDARHRLSLDRAGGDALDEELAEDEIDDERRDGGEQRRRHVRRCSGPRRSR